MPYDSIRDLPRSVRDNLPKQAQQIYRKAFNSAWRQYADPARRRSGGSREETAHRVAWAAVEKVYSKHPDGKWRRRADHRS
jgi:cation transport regulator